MSTLAMMLVIFSAFLHAGWNVLGKSNRGSGIAFTLAASVAVSVILTPYIIWYLSTIGWSALPKYFWFLVMVSGISQIIYMIRLIVAYKYADIGVIYPIVRSLPVLMVGVVSSFLGQRLDVQQWLGFVLITLGCVFVPLASFRAFKLSSYINLGVFWAVIAAIGTTGYSIIDKQALDVVTRLVHEVVSDTYTSIFYLGVQYWAMVLPILTWCVLGRQSHQIVGAWKIRKQAGLAGIMIGVTYGVVLVAMNMTTNISLLVALRQVSIVIGLIMGCIFLGESWSFTRVLGVILIMTGLVMSFG